MTGAISRPNTATKLENTMGNDILGTNMTIKDKIKQPLQRMANFVKNGKILLMEFI